jgi:ubiquinone/menaquinone biosynthesis C-methylase UbiE
MRLRKSKTQEALMTTQAPGYLDVQAEVGITKHLGGFKATDELLRLCHIENAGEVLYAGCGIGVGPTYIAKKHGCRVVGVDISPRMIEWCHVRARMAKVETLTEFRVADILELPFESDRFEVVLVESVVAFIKDKRRAIRELIRVAKPGGYVGINETFLYQELSSDMKELANKQLGLDIPRLESWQELWDASGLQERVAKTYPLESREQVRSQIQWVGLGWALKALWRLYRLSRQNPAARESIRSQFSSGSEIIGGMGYALFAGKK